MTPEIKAKIQAEAERRIPHLKGDSVEMNLTRSGFIIGFNAGASYYASLAESPQPKEGDGAEELAKTILLKHYGRPNQPFTDVQIEANKHILAALVEMYHAARPTIGSFPLFP